MSELWKRCFHQKPFIWTKRALGDFLGLKMLWQHWKYETIRLLSSLVRANFSDTSSSGNTDNLNNSSGPLFCQDHFPWWNCYGTTEHMKTIRLIHLPVETIFLMNNCSCWQHWTDENNTILIHFAVGVWPYESAFWHHWMWTSKDNSFVIWQR
jgi:hypothetical protein